MFILSILRSIVREGSLQLVDASGRVHMIGDGTPPRASIRLRSRRIGYTLAFNPGLLIGEAYMDGRLAIEQGTISLCANDDETPAPFEFRLGHRRMTSWLCPTQMAQPN